MSRELLAGTINHSTTVRIIDSTTGAPELAVTSATGGLAFKYRRTGAVAVAITALNDLSALTDAHTDGGILHIGDGYYRVDYQDAAFAAGATDVLLTGTATGMVVIGELYDLGLFDAQDGVRGGLTALPNAAAEAAGGLVTSAGGATGIDDLATPTNITAGTITTVTTNTDMRGTDSAALASVCTEARLAELDAANLPTDVAAIPTTAMRGTDNAALASVCTEPRLAELDAANLPTDVAAIPTTAMRGTDNAALASVATEARLAELDAANLPTDVAAIPTAPALATVCTEARLAELDAANLPTDVAAIPTAPALASVCTEARLAELDAANLPTDVAAIPTTAMRGTDNAALASVATEARLAELDAANLPTDVDTINTNVTANKVILDALGATAAGRLALAAVTMVTGTVDNTAFTATTTELETDTITTAATDHYKDRHIIFTSGTLQDQETSISVYTLTGGRGHFTFPALTSAPADDDTFIII